MRPLLSRDQMRKFDAVQVERGVPGVLLMENAGRGAAHLIGLKSRPRPEHEARRKGSAASGTCVRCADERSLSGLRVLVLAGPGNNGGDGFVVARHLHLRGALVRVFGVRGASEYAGDAAVMLGAMEGVGVPLQPLPGRADWPSVFSDADVVVDALLGTGASRALEGELLALVLALNTSGAFVIALDVPSGLDVDTGEVLGSAVLAHHTVTFAHLKRGLLTTEGHRHSGTITVSHIGVPSTLPFAQLPAAWLLEESDVRAPLVPRSSSGHKGSAGRVVVLAGSAGTVGAARLVSGACFRSGAGVVTVATDFETASKLETEVAEVMTYALTGGEEDMKCLQSAHVLAVGPGFGQSDVSRRAMDQAFACGRPLVLDADALRYVATGGAGSYRAARPACVVLTPHPGEAALMLGVDVPTIERARFAAASRLADSYEAIVVLKGSRTIIAAPGCAPLVSAFGSPALSTAGSGDVLTGILAALLLGVTTIEEAFVRAGAAVGIHGLCGEAWEKSHGDRGLLASEIALMVPQVITSILSADPALS